MSNCSPLPAASTPAGPRPPCCLRPRLTKESERYTVSGSKFNGVSQDGAYGDDFQDATNYPLIRFAQHQHGTGLLCRTHDHSTMAVGYQGPTYTHVDIPTGIPTGGYNMQIVVNGISSANYLVAIH